MIKKIQCVVLKREADAMEKLVHPGELGERIYENVSAEGWTQWLDRLASIINENGLNTADEKSLQVIEDHMLGFFFGEGEGGALPSGFKGGK